MPQTVFLIGYYGYHNAGDELLCGQAQAFLRDRLGDVRFHILGKTTSRRDILGLVTSILASDRVVFGGGSLFQDVTSRRSLVYYLFWVVLARFLGKKILFLGHGLGPLSPFGRRLFRWVVPTETWVMRDSESVTLLQKIRPDIMPQRSADLCFYQAQFEPVIPGLKIGVSLRSCSFTLPSELVDGLKKLQVESRYFLLQPSADLTATFHALDTEFVSDLVNLSSLATHSDPFAAMREEYALCKWVVGMRYHSLVLAAIFGLPFIALSMDDKLTSLARQLGQPVWNLRQKNSQSFANCVAEMNTNYADYRTHIHRRVPELMATFQGIAI